MSLKSDGAGNYPPKQFFDKVGTYLNAGNFCLHILKNGIRKWKGYTKDHFKVDLQYAIEKKIFDPISYEKLTGDEFENQAELDGYLTALYAYIFQDGPWPDK